MEKERQTDKEMIKRQFARSGGLPFLWQDRRLCGNIVGKKIETQRKTILQNLEGATSDNNAEIKTI